MTDEATVRLTTSQAVIRYLVAQYSSRDGAETRLIPGFLGIFGHGNTGGFAQAIGQTRNEAFFMEGRNEQGMAHIAAAYAKAMRREATLACTASVGPGSTNMLTAAAGAYINRLPLVLLPADGYAARRPGTILQGLENPAGADLTVNDCFRPVSRFFDRIMRPEQLLDTLPRAMRTLTDPVETGPVVLSVPQDVQVEAFDFPTRLFERRVWSIARPLPEQAPLNAAIDLLVAATRPVIVAGGGVLYSRAESELLAFAEAAGIPVVETLAGKGAMPSSSALALGGLGVSGAGMANEVARTADLVVCIGTRLSDYVTASQSIFQNPRVRFIGLNISYADAVKYGGLPVIADAREALSRMTTIISDRHATPRDDYLAEVSSIADSWNATRTLAVSAEPGPPLRQTELVGILNDDLKAGDTLVTSAGTLPGDVFRYWVTKPDVTVHIEFGYSCMGYDIAGAIGVGLAPGDGQVFALLGDGTFLLSPSDLAVAVQHRRKITVIVSDNQGMRSIRRLESRNVAQPYANTFEYRDPYSYDMDNPIGFDIGKIAEGMGARVLTATTREEFGTALQVSRDCPEPCFIVVTTDAERAPAVDSPWWDIAPPEVDADGQLDAARETYKRGQEAQRFHY
ncbi:MULTISPECIES: thiamine pyrophosphate-dependent enzyme [unclassified Mycolicibacterium]|uniref:thiamine pyrophosphate-dependent enzyme n=1 Tax=unclassified Mycolicibacterium TaxID=2636767 RepID=UPI0013908172|nr:MULTISPECIES: thiamine pyrophosphate-dependent enzyme [unclassified Mycolicibacterium]